MEYPQNLAHTTHPIHAQVIDIFDTKRSDIRKHFPAANAFLRSAAEAGGRVLVHCLGEAEGTGCGQTASCGCACPPHPSPCLSQAPDAYLDSGRQSVRDDLPSLPHARARHEPEGGCCVCVCVPPPSLCCCMCWFHRVCLVCRTTEGPCKTSQRLSVDCICMHQRVHCFSQLYV